MEWSRYNHLFDSRRFGFFLYNALSNTLLELDEAHYRALEEMRGRGGAEQGGGPAADPGFAALLIERAVLVGAGDEERAILARRYERKAVCFNTARLALTVCPTLACNFRCPYCFEASQGDAAVMSPDTIAALIAFIARHEDARALTLSWYGGEPTLAWHVIEEVTGRVQALDITFEHAGLVTNGYLLDAARIARLNDLRIRSIQITLDGPPEVHDRRRVLAGGGATYARILENVGALMESRYEGACSIRVNIDKHNAERFIELRSDLLERFAGKKLHVYPGHVNTSLGGSYDHACSIDLDGWTQFTVDLYHQARVLPREGFHPAGRLHGVCTATRHNGFVVGPRGELYKCWEDVGRSEMAIGNVHEEEPITGPGLRALYVLGTDAYTDPECLACAVLPICGGGCAGKRLRTRHFGEEGLAFCSPYKEHLTAYLEEYYHAFRRREMCAAVLTPGPVAGNTRGYRVVSPQPRREKGETAAVLDPFAEGV